MQNGVEGRGIHLESCRGNFSGRPALSIYHVERKEETGGSMTSCPRFFLIELKFDRSTAVHGLYANVHAGIME